MAEEKTPTMKRTIQGYEKESKRSGSCEEGKGRQENNRAF